jgi:hypothetical protein
MNTDKPLVPTIHLNGNSRESLFDDYSKAAEAASQAVEALRSVDLHPRNYYVQGDDAWLKAREQHQEVMSGLLHAEKFLTHMKMSLRE